MSPVPLDIAVLTRQTERLSLDLAELTERTYAQSVAALAALGRSEWASVCVVGDGDSYHAARAAEMAFETLGCVPCEPLSAQRFLGYHVDQLPTEAMDTLVVAVSASGRTERVLQALECAQARGITTLAVTGASGSPLAQAAAASVTVTPADLERSPGIRTYQASLLGLLLLAVGLGAAGAGDRRTQLLLTEIRSLTEALPPTERGMREQCEALGRSWAKAPIIAVLGSGPSEGTAKYCAAKLVEGAGVMAFGQDLEEWWHVERFAAPLDMPLVVLAPPGRSQPRAVEVAMRAAELGRRVITVLPDSDEPDTGAGSNTLRVRGEVREEFSALVYHLFAGHLAAALAGHLGRRPFQNHRVTGPARS